MTHAQAVRWGIAYILAPRRGVSVACLAIAKGSRISIVSVYILQMVRSCLDSIALLICRIGEAATVFMIFMTAFPRSSSTHRAGSVVQSLIEGWRGCRDLKVPHVPFRPPARFGAILIDGLRIGLANGWRVRIAAEMVVGVALGLGYVIIQSRYDLDYVAAFVSIVVICLIGLTVEKTFFVVLEDKVRERLGMYREG